MDALDLEKTKPIFEKSGVTYAALFGSYARGEQKSTSDVDILIRVNPPFSLFDLIGLERELGDILGKKIDLVTESAISKYIKDEVISESKTIYEKA